MAKRIFDSIVSATLLCLLTPIFLIIACLIKLNIGSPIFFRQTRPGFNGQPFEILKFRTLLNKKNRAGELLPDDQRITRFGRILRATSVDELPELWNVLKGEMSLVGPRPLLINYLSLYTQEQMRRHEVKPGITGWAQINGRNSISWEEKFKFDIWYVTHHSFLLDLYILGITLKKVLLQTGITANDQSTMPFFTGNNDLDKLR